MLITVRFFGSYADNLGIKHADLTLSGGASVTDLLSSIATLPGAGTLPNNPLVAVNQVYASNETQLHSGDEVALIPPVAGG
jgi:molybdopterin converting factor subunit 1